MTQPVGKLSRELPDGAAEWDARLRAPDCTEAERAAFNRWCAASPEHQRSFDELQAALASLREARDRPEIRSLREAALGAASPARRWRRWIAPAVGIGVAAAAAFAVVTLRPLAIEDSRQAAAPPSYATAVGERSTTSFDDGTVAVLNTNTRLEVDYADTERRVTLRRGQALFDVAKDPMRPFVVVAGEQRITAVGTVFDVRYEGNAIEVTLVEGVVDVAPKEPVGANLNGPSPELATVRLNAGQRLVTTALATPSSPVVETADVETATMWREGRVFFEDAPLSEAVAEMNRYSTTAIVVADPGLDRHRVNGMFRTGQQGNFVEALEAYFLIQVERDANGRIVLSAKDQ
jgi:transmembrane sensor